MKINLAFVAITFLIIFSCSEQKKEENQTSMVFSGKVDDQKVNKIAIFTGRQGTLFTIDVSDGKFSDTLDVKKGKYLLNYGGPYFTEIYLEPNYDLNLLINTKKELSYKGKGAKENNYLLEKSKLNKSFNESGNDYFNITKLPEDLFLKKYDSIHQITTNFFNKHKDSLSKTFRFIESNSLKYKHLTGLSSYQGMKRQLHGEKSFTVSENYPNIFQEIDLTDESLLSVSEYLGFVHSYIAKLTDTITKDKASLDYEISFLETVNKEIKNPKLKEKIVLTNIGYGALERTKQLDDFYSLATSLIVEDKNSISKLTKAYDKLKKISKGTVSPDFELKDENGKIYTLKDFKGKYTYIDIWATWCGPCVKEMPALNKLEKDYENINFVGICADNKKNMELWKKMIVDKELKGVQLFRPNSTTNSINISFFKEYIVNSYPRYILIDDKGKIVDANAPRPSDLKIRKVFDNLLSNRTSSM